LKAVEESFLSGDGANVHVVALSLLAAALAFAARPLSKLATARSRRVELTTLSRSRVLADALALVSGRTHHVPVSIILQAFDETFFIAQLANTSPLPGTLLPSVSPLTSFAQAFPTALTACAVHNIARSK